MIFNGETFRSLLIEAEAELYEEDTNIRFKPSDRFKIQLNKKLKAENKERIYSFMSVKRNRVLTVVIAALLAASLAMSAGAIREAVFGFIINIFEDHSTIYIDKNGKDKVKVIEEFYVPSYVPEGYELKSENYDRMLSSIYWKNADNDSIYYEQTIYYSAINIDRAEFIETRYINDKLIVNIYRSSRTVSVLWNDNKYIYIINSEKTLSEEELIKMAKSLQKTEFTKS